MKPKLLIADDHMLVAEGIQKLLESEVDFVASVCDGRALMQAVETHNPDIVVVDISLPLLNGLDATRQIKKSRPELKVIILTMHAEQMYVTEAFRIGVSGYVLKQSVSSELLQAIREVVKGNTFVSPTIAQGLIDRAVNPPQESMEGREDFATPLSSRQREVLQLLAEGRSNKEIASILNVTIKTVEFHKTRIIKQLGLRTTAELTKYAIAHGLVSLQ